MCVFFHRGIFSATAFSFLSSGVLVCGACACYPIATLLSQLRLIYRPPPSYQIPSLIPAPQKIFTTPPSLLFSHPHSQKPQKPSTEPHPVNPSCPYPMQEPEHGPPFFDTRMDIFTVEPLDGQRKAHSLSVVFDVRRSAPYAPQKRNPEA